MTLLRRFCPYLVSMVTLALLLTGCASPTARPLAAPNPDAVHGDYHAVLADLKDKAVQQIVDSARSDDPFLRANAMEATQNLTERATALVQLGLADQQEVVRFSALATMGKLQLVNLVPMARRCLDDPSASVRGAALYALRRCHQPVDISPLGAMLASSNPSVRGNAAILLGRLGDPSAIAMLKSMAGTPLPRANPVQDALVRLQVAEAIARLGDDSVLDAIRAAVYSQFDELRVMAVLLLGDLGDRRFEKGVEQLLQNPPVELQLAAAATLAKFGRNDGLEVALHAASNSLPTVRSQAAITLGLFRDVRAVQALKLLQDDAAEQVRLSAATAVLRGLAPEAGG